MVNARPRASSASYLESLPFLIGPIFDQVQNTVANHRKNLVSLRNIQEQCSGITADGPKGLRAIGEKAFNAAFIDMVNRILPVKKGVAVADRAVKFVASYVAYTTEQDQGSGPDDAEVPNTTYTRFVSKLLRHLLSGMEAKDKNVRFRVTLLTVSMVNGLGETSEDMYILLRESFLARANDKEAAVRVQAALGLAKLSAGEDVDDLEPGEVPLQKAILGLLRYDPAAEVRRAALYNLPHNSATLPHIMGRTRDVDPILRRTVYHGPLSAAALPDPRILTIAQREKVVQYGLGDREPSVRKAAATMLGGWVDQAGGDLVEFLNRFDVVSSETAEDALTSVFVIRPDLYKAIAFDAEYWENMTVERAFLARVYVDHCIKNKDETIMEDVLPTVSDLAFRIQEEYNKLEETFVTEDEDELAERSFIVGELMRLAVNMDYTDQFGRSTMFQHAREMISQPNLPARLVDKCMDILCKIANSERDLIRIVVDVVSELREGQGEEEIDAPTPSGESSAGSPVRRKTMVGGTSIDDPDQAVKKALVDLRALLICISMLQRINSKLQDNSVFHGLLPELIIPAVQNTEEPALRDQGLMCLALCCMIDEEMASKSFGLFVNTLQTADEQLQVQIMYIIYDLLILHDNHVLVSGTLPPDQLVGLVRHTLGYESPEVQAAACTGAVKLLLTHVITDPLIIHSLVLLYFSPDTVDNQSLRQCLSYFLPVYCYSSSEHQRNMLSIFTDTLEMLAQMCEDAERDQPMLPLAQMGLMMVDWLDPQKVVEREGVEIDHSIHIDLAIEILKAILTETAKVRKAYISFLGKLTLAEPEEVEGWKIKAIQTLILAIPEKRPVADAASRNAIVRFEGAIQKRFRDQLEGYDQDTFRGDENEEVVGLFGFIDDVDERDPDSVSETGSRRHESRPRDYSETPSEMTVTEEDDEEDQEEDPDPTPKKSAPVSRNKRRSSVRQVVKAEPEEEEEEEDDETETEGGDTEDVEGLLEDQEDSEEESEEESEDEMLL